MATMTESLTESPTERAIDAATRRNGRVFIAYIAVLLLTALIIAIFTWLTWDSGNKLQDAIRADAKARITDAMKDLPALQKAASDAKAAQQQIETELAKQQARAATAERSLLELQERIKPRNLTDEQADAFTEALEVFPRGIIDFGYTSAGGDETFNFARQFLPLFKRAGWTVRNEASIANHFDIQVIGVGILISVPAGPDPTKPPSGSIELTPTLRTLQAAFRAVGIEIQFISWFPGKDVPEVVIGSKLQPVP